MTREECIALLDRYANYDGMGIPNLTGCKEAMKKAVELLSAKPDKSLEEAAEKYCEKINHRQTTIITDSFKAGAEWAFRQGWTFEAHKGAFGICFDGNIDKLLESLKDNEEVTVQIRKK